MRRPVPAQPSLLFIQDQDSYEHNDLTPSIGREIPHIQINKILTSPNADTLIRDLAIIGLLYLFCSANMDSNAL
jgi:hypothetical protein